MNNSTIQTLSFIFDNVNDYILLHQIAGEGSQKRLHSGIKGSIGTLEDMNAAAIRSIREASGLEVKEATLRGVVKTIQTETETSVIYFVYESARYSGELENKLPGRLKWVDILNIFNLDIEFGQALGQDHSINGNESIAIGIGAITRAFREIILGSYPTEDPLANPLQWVSLDRLLTVGKGINEENRDDALILFKSGLLELCNGIQIKKYDHRTEEGELVEPEDGTIQFTPEKGLELRENNKWNKVGDKNYHHEQVNPSRVWEITHNLAKYPTVTITDVFGNEYEGDIKQINENMIVLTFSAALAGFADLN